MRRSELGAITRADVDLERHALRVRRGVSKAKREDWIPLRSDIVDMLADTLVQTDDPLSPVFRDHPAYQDVPPRLWASKGSMDRRGAGRRGACAMGGV